MRVLAVSIVFQCVANGADAPIHHVRGCNDVGAGFSMRQCLFNQHLNGFVVEHIAGFVDQAILAVAGERIQGNIGNDAQFRAGLFEGAHGTLRQPIRVEGLSCIVTFLFPPQ